MKRPITIFSIVVALALVGASVATGLPVNPYPTAPLCATHDDRAWHGLWNADAGCHYDHTHGDDPHAVDDIFGVQAYADFGGEISYPWQTFSTAGTENELKHEGYYWIVRRDLPCTVDGSVTAFRILEHMMADGHDTDKRYHSVYGEIETCASAANPNVRGIVRVGGWQDSGDLLIDGQVAINVTGNGNCHKQHSATSGMAVWYPCLRYGEQGPDGFARFDLAIHNEWDITTTANPGAFTDYVCYPNARCVSNGTFVRPHLIQVDVPPEAEAILDPDGNHIVEHFAGYTTVYGVIDPACLAVSATCVPFEMTNVRTNLQYAYRDIDPGRSYDVWFCNGVQCTSTSPGRRTSNWAQPHH